MIFFYEKYQKIYFICNVNINTRKSYSSTETIQVFKERYISISIISRMGEDAVFQRQIIYYILIYILMYRSRIVMQAIIVKTIPSCFFAFYILLSIQCLKGVVGNDKTLLVVREN